MSKQLDLVISILKESATAHKIGDTVWAKDSVKRYITHAGKIVDISPGKITIKKLSGALTTHNTEDVSKDYEHLNPNPYRKNESEEIEESFTVKDASGKVVHVALTQSAAEKKAAELQASTKEKHTAGYSREAVVKEDTIDELNKSTVDSYKEKATDELKQAKKYSKSEYGDIAKRIMARRTSGLSRVLKRNEPEDIKEFTNDINESIIKWKRETVKRHGDVEFIKKSSTGGLNNRTTIARRPGGDILAVYHHATNVGTIFSAVKESSMNDLASGKGDGKELKASPEYRRDRRRTAQMLAAQKEVQARVKRGYAEDDKDLDEGILSKVANKVMGAAPKEPKYKVGQVVSYETPEDQPDWKDRGRGKGTITKYSNGHYTVNGNPVNHFDIKKVHESIDEATKGHTIEAQGVRGMKSTPWRKTFKNVDHLNKWAEANDSVEIHGTRDLEQAKKGNLSPAIREDLDEAKLASPLKGHIYHTKSDAELRGIVKDAGETARVQKGMSSEGKYLDQMNDASTVLHYRSKGGKQITATNSRMVAPKSTEDSIKAKLAKWNKSESSSTQNPLEKATHITKKDIRHSDGGIVPEKTTLRNVEGDKYEIRSGRYKGKIATFHPDNLQKLDEAINKSSVDDFAKGNGKEPKNSKYKVEGIDENKPGGVIEEISTTLLKSYAKKAREDARKLSKQGDAAKTDKTKLAKYVKATKRHLNAHKAEDKISSNEFYGKK